MPAFTLTINFDQPIQDSVSVGDTAYYVYTFGVGGFEINESNIVEIGEITRINREYPYSMVCNTDLYGDQLEIGCGEGVEEKDKEEEDRDDRVVMTEEECREAYSMYEYYFKLHRETMDNHNEWTQANPNEGGMSPYVDDLNEYGLQIQYWHNRMQQGDCEELYGNLGDDPDVPIMMEANPQGGGGRPRGEEPREEEPREGGPIEEDRNCGHPFILFSKNNCQELKSVLGYYSLFRFINTSKERAELFNVTVDAYESSK